LTIRCDGFGFHPGAGKVFEEDGRLLANRFRHYDPVPVKPLLAERRLLVKFLRHLFPRGSDLAWLKHLLDTYAFLVQKPGERVKFTMILVGAIEGSGKSTLMEEVPRLLFGTQNVVTVSTHELEGRFTDYLGQAWIVVFAEVALGTARDAARVANTLKDNQTNDRLRLEEKYRAPRTQPNRVTFFGTSNDEEHALHLSTFDRRSAISATPASIMPQSLATALHSFFRSSRSAGVVRHLALRRVLTHFDPNAAPPLTESKKRMIEASRPAVHAEMVDAFQSKDPPFHRDLVLVESVRNCLAQRGLDVRNLSDRKVGEFLRAAPIAARRMEHQKRITAPAGGSCRVRPWVLRNAELWEKASEKQIDRHFTSGAPILLDVAAAPTTTPDDGRVALESQEQVASAEASAIDANTAEKGGGP